MPNKCPRCKRELTDDEIKSLWAARTSGMRKVKTGGRHGGRPPKKKKKKPEAATST